MGSYFLIIIVMVAGLIVQGVLSSKFNKYSRIMNAAGMTGAEVARRMLSEHGIYDVDVISTPGQLTDHYNPQNKTINLSEGVYGSNSIAAAAVAAHECGHAVQHAQGYAPLQFRSALVPVVSFSNNIVSWILLAGVILINAFPAILWLGIALFAMSTLFSVVTLPVEINASSRALRWLNTTGISAGQTGAMAKDALKWAAYTYVVAAISSIATLLYYIGIARRD
ncbi:MAG: zinc metallopeptidase [Bacteroidales bacterium]|nr:zinc metallopeptidase [Bacteroidales bacterium]